MGLVGASSIQEQEGELELITNLLEQLVLMKLEEDWVPQMVVVALFVLRLE